MFVKLRNKFVLTNLAITTAVLVIAFTAIYIVFISNSPPRRDTIMNRDPNLQVIIESRLSDQVESSRAQLAATLIITGLATELLVFGASILIAERAIKPIREAYEQQKSFIANASHELKTPVAAIAANLEALESEVPAGKWTLNIHSELNKMSNLLSHLLALAKADDDSNDEKPRKTNVNKLLEKILPPFTLRAEQKGIKLTENFAKNTPPAELPQLTLTNLLEIILDNAIKYAKSNITVSTTKNEISISNDGPTIPAEKLPRIFDRFYQIDKSSEGSGLGLSIASALAEKYSWGLTATSEKGQTTFTLKI